MAPTAATIILIDATELVRRGWCQGDDARDAKGRKVAPGSPSACRWSLLGAIVASAGGAERLQDRRTLADVAKASLAIGLATGEESLRDWNDARGRTVGEVVAAFEDAVALLERFRPSATDVLA